MTEFNPFEEADETPSPSDGDGAVGSGSDLHLKAPDPDAEDHEGDGLASAQGERELAPVDGDADDGAGLGSGDDDLGDGDRDANPEGDPEGGATEGVQDDPALPGDAEADAGEAQDALAGIVQSGLLTTAAALLGDTPEEEIPPQPHEQPSTLGPGEWFENFYVEKTPKKGHGITVHILLDDDVLEPLGIWLEREHPNLDGPDLEDVLLLMGLPGEHAAWFAMQRQKRRDAQGLPLSPGMEGLVIGEEEHRRKQERAISAFAKSFKEREKKR